MTSLLQSIYNELPRYRDTCEQIERLRTQPPKFPNLREPHEVATMAILDRLEAGESFDGLAADIANAHAESQSTLLARNAVPAAMKKLENWRDEIISRSTDTILHGLRTALNDVVIEAEKLAPFREISDADSAIAAGRVDDYTRLHELTRRYVEIRREQVKMLRQEYASENGRHSAKTAIAAMISNVPEVFPDWAPWISHGVWENRDASRADRTIQVPWPIASRTYVGTSPEFFVWALNAGAKLWLPTFADFEATSNELNTKARQPRPDRSPEGYRDPLNGKQPGQAFSGMRRKPNEWEI